MDPPAFSCKQIGATAESKFCFIWEPNESQIPTLDLYMNITSVFVHVF